MKISPMPAVECALLHANFAPIPAQAIFEEAVRIARELGVVEDVQPIITSTSKDAHMFFGDLRVLVSQNPEPLAPRGFEGAFSLTSTHLGFPQARAVVAAHRASTCVTIGKGLFNPSVLGPTADLLEREFMERVVGDSSSFTTSEEVELAVHFCRRLSIFVHERHAATALHWCMNDFLLQPSDFMYLAKINKSELLAVNPLLSSSAGRLGPGEPVAVYARGSQWLLGRMLCFEEERVPAAYMISRIMHFIGMCRLRGSIIPEGDTFGIDETEVIHVSWKDADEVVPMDYILLRILRSDEHGINHDPPPQVHLRYDNKGRIRDIDADELPQMVLDDPEFEAELAARRAALDVPHPRVDLTALREIAMARNPQAEPVRPSLFSKLVGQFTRH